jgi:hypothetical protein
MSISMSLLRTLTPSPLTPTYPIPVYPIYLIPLPITIPLPYYPYISTYLMPYHIPCSARLWNNMTLFMAYLSHYPHLSHNTT